ncbi:ExeA family protein [Thermodesulfobacteriota bacterium]
MYESFYKLSKKPFNLLPDPDFMFLSEKHRRALSLLEYGLLDQAGFIVVTGPIGAGKTTLIRHLLKKKKSEKMLKVAVIFNTQLSPDELLEPVLDAFELPYQGKTRTERLSVLREFLERESVKKSQIALIIDEAQNLPLGTLEEIRLLSNMETGDRHFMQIVLVGQPGLRDKLSDPMMLPFVQRVIYDYQLLPLNAEEISKYVKHRLSIAGAADDGLFTDEAIGAIHQYSGGIPRLINLIAHMALVYGFADKLEKIEPDVIKEVVKDWETGKHLQVNLNKPIILEQPRGDSGANGSLDELRSSVMDIKLQQDHLFKVVEILCSDQRKKDLPIHMRLQGGGDKARQRSAQDHLEMWTRVRRLLSDRDQEVQRYRDRIRDLEIEIERLKGRQ